MGILNDDMKRVVRHSAPAGLGFDGRPHVPEQLLGGRQNTPPDAPGHTLSLTVLHPRRTGNAPFFLLPRVRFFEYPGMPRQTPAPPPCRQQGASSSHVLRVDCCRRWQRCASCLPSNLRSRPGRGLSLMAASSPSSTNRFRTLATVAALIKSTPAISPSRSPSSALSNASARLTVRTDGLPRWETSLRRERSDSANSTLYLMAAMSGYSPTESMPKYGCLLIFL